MNSGSQPASATHTPGKRLASKRTAPASCAWALDDVWSRTRKYEFAVIDKELLTVLCCPATRQHLGIAPQRLIGAVNERESYPFVQFSPDGWFSVNLGIVGSGWIAPDEGRLVGPWVHEAEECW